MASINSMKLGRIRAMATAIIDELHRGTLDERTRKRLEQLTYDTLVEMGSALPTDLLEELGRLVPPSRDAQSTDAELRVLWAQLLGWIDGMVIATAFDDAVADAEAVSAATSAPWPALTTAHTETSSARASPYL